MQALPRGSFRLIAHRGAPMRAPENTLRSFRVAQSLGAREIETDVQLSRDGVLVLCHDNTLARYGHGERLVESCAYFGDGGLAEMDFGKWFSDEFAAERIATLAELLDAYGEAFLFHIELKGAHPRLAEETLRQIEARGLLPRCVLTSFSFEQLSRARGLSEDIRLGWLVSDIDESVWRGAEQLRLFQLCPKASAVTPERVQQSLKIVQEVRAWGCPRTKPEARETIAKLEAAGCVGVTVDELGWFKEE